MTAAPGPFDDAPALEVPCRTMADYAATLREPPWPARWQQEQLLVQDRPRWRARRLPGYCEACDRPSTFLVPGRRRMHDLPSWFLPNLLACAHCRLLQRQRKVAALLDRLDTTSRLYLTEQCSRPFARARARWRGELVGSEYLGPTHRGGATVRGIRHEDVQALSFADGSFDVVVSCDVLEHVPRPDAAVRELRRVLAPGGTLLLTVPFRGDTHGNRVRAVVEDGVVQHRLEPQYHHDPLSRRGVLVFTDFGWQLVDELRDAGFADVAVVLYHSFAHGYLGIPSQYVLAR